MSKIMTENILVETKNLNTHFTKTTGIFFNKKTQTTKAVKDVSLKIPKGEIMGLVGESGCGKSTFGRSILKLITPTSGDIYFKGENITTLSKSEMIPYRKKMQMIFQDPYGSLNPRMSVFDIISEPLLVHNIANSSNVNSQVAKIMNLVGLAKRYVKKYPHEFSGGQRQRIAIARSLAVEPEFIVADEPVSALDVSIQSQILNLLLDLKNELELTILFISHDLSVVKYICNNVAVMYNGEIQEEQKTSDLFKNPTADYTKKLLESIPKISY